MKKCIAPMGLARRIETLPRVETRGYVVSPLRGVSSTSLLLSIRQREHVHSESRLWRINFGRNRVRYEPWTAAASSRRHGDILLVADAVGYREPLYRSREFGFPQHFAGLYVDRLEHLIAVAHES